MADIRIVQARYGHIRTIAARMRQADRDEVFASSGRSPAGSLLYSLRASSVAWTVFIDGRPEVMFGVGVINIVTGTAAPWLLGTDAVHAHYREFLRTSPNLKDQLLNRYPVLRNFVDARNTVSVRWLRWLGATLSDPIEIRGHMFHLFELRA